MSQFDKLLMDIQVRSLIEELIDSLTELKESLKKLEKEIKNESN